MAACLGEAVEEAEEEAAADIDGEDGGDGAEVEVSGGGGCEPAEDGTGAAAESDDEGVAAGGVHRPASFVRESRREALRCWRASERRNSVSLMKVEAAERMEWPERRKVAEAVAAPGTLARGAGSVRERMMRGFQKPMVRRKTTESMTS